MLARFQHDRRGRNRFTGDNSEKAQCSILHNRCGGIFDGHQLADVAALMGTFDIVFGEVDR